MQAHIKRIWVIIFGVMGLLGFGLMVLSPTPKAETSIETGYSEARFFRQMAPDVKTLATSYGIKPSILLAHLAVETDFGQSLLFQRYHNAYGLSPKAGQSQIQLATSLYGTSDGNVKTVRFATYSSWPESLRDYLARLKADEKKQYQRLAHADKVKDAAAILATLSRRQQEQYAKDIEKLVSQYQLSKYDN